MRETDARCELPRASHGRLCRCPGRGRRRPADYLACIRHLTRPSRRVSLQRNDHPRHPHHRRQPRWTAHQRLLQPVRRRRSLCPRMAEPYITLNELAHELWPVRRCRRESSGSRASRLRSSPTPCARLLSHFCNQARATAEDGPESIRRAGLRATHASAVLITQGASTSNPERSAVSPRTTSASSRSGY